MFDGFSIQRLYMSYERLLSLDFKELRDKVRINTAESIKEYGLNGTYKSLILTVKAEAHQHSTLDLKLTSKLSGSFHKFSNEGLHNCNDFSVADSRRVLNGFVVNFGIDPFKSELTSLEFGVNVQLPFEAKKLLDSLLLYKNKAFSREYSEGDLLYRKCELTEYTVKIYAKRASLIKHDTLSEERLLRFEVKVNDMDFLKKKGIRIRTLENLLNVSLYPLLGTLLVEICKQILFEDLDMNHSRLSHDECKRLLKAKNMVRTVGSKVAKARHKNKAEYSDVGKLRNTVKPSHEDKMRLKKKKDAKRQRELRAKKYIQSVQQEYPALIDFQELLQSLIKSKWEELTKTDDRLLGKISSTLDKWSKIDYGHHNGTILWEELQYLARVPK